MNQLTINDKLSYMCTVYSITMPISSAQPTSHIHTHTHNCSQNYANGMKCKWATTTNRSKTAEEGVREYIYVSNSHANLRVFSSVHHRANKTKQTVQTENRITWYMLVCVRHVFMANGH